jgi:putative Mn2+ efflux pump MntP
MGLLTSILVGVGLAMDAFAVSLGVGTAGRINGLRAKLRLAFHFGWFQLMMTVLGWLAGSTISGLINQYDHWIALVLLAYVGRNMIRSGLSPEEDCYRCDIGVVTFLISGMGLMAGTGLGARLGKRMEILGGVILIVIGLRVVSTHLL